MKPLKINSVESNFNNGEFQLVISEIKKIKSQKLTLDLVFLLELNYFESRTFERLAKWDIAWKIFLNSKKAFESDVEKSDSAKLILLVHEQYLNWRIGKIKEGTRIVEDNKNFLANLESMQEMKHNTFEFDKWLGLYYIIITNFYLNIGELDTAWNFNNKSYQFFEKIQYTLYIAKNLTNQGEIFRLKGDLSSSLEKYLTAYEISKLLNDKITNVDALYNIGNINYLMGNSEEAKLFYLLSKEIAESVQNYVFQAKINYKLIVMFYNERNLGELEKYLHYLNNLNELSQKNDYIQLLTNIGTALKHYLIGTMRENLQAQELLKKIYNQPVIDFESHFFVIILLTEILLLEYKIFNNVDILEDIDKITKNAFELTRTKGSMILLVEVQLLQAKIYIISGRLEEAEELLLETQETAKKLKFNLILKKIVKEYSHFKEQLDKWKELIETNASGSKRLELAEINSYLQELRKFAFK
jgi:tetratricopeptide (TPR) repeat protein